MSSANPDVVTISGRAGVAVTMRFVPGVDASGIDIDGVPKEETARLRGALRNAP
jgi:hypothetical protein